MLYYLGSEQQMRRSECADAQADLCLLFAYDKQVFSWHGSYEPHAKLLSLAAIKYLHFQ